MAGPALIPVIIGTTIYRISKPLYTKFSPQLTKATKEAVEKAGSISKIGSNKLIKLLGGQKPTKASLSQKGVKKIVGKGAAATFGTGVLVGSKLKPRGKRDAAEREMEQRKKGGKFPQATDKPKGKAALYKATPKRKPEKPKRKPPALGKAKKIEKNPTPPKGMLDPMDMKSGTKKYAGGGAVYRKRNYAYGGRVAKYNKG